jgi:hypothetical protein
MFDRLSEFSTAALKKAQEEFEHPHTGHFETRVRAENHLLKEMLDKELEQREKAEAAEKAQASDGATSAKEFVDRVAEKAGAGRAK